MTCRDILMETQKKIIKYILVDDKKKDNKILKRDDTNVAKLCC